MRKYLHIDPTRLTDDEWASTYTELQWLMAQEGNKNYEK